MTHRQPAITAPFLCSLALFASTGCPLEADLGNFTDPTDADTDGSGSSDGPETSVTEVTTSTGTDGDMSPTDDTGGSGTLGGTTTAETGTSGPGSACPEELPAADDCCCFSHVAGDHETLTEVVNSCPMGADECDTIEASCARLSEDGSCPGDDFTLDEPDTVACVLDALLDAVPAVVRWNISYAGYAGRRSSVHIASDHTVFSYTQEYYDISSQVGDVSHIDLPPASFFEDCAALATPLEQFKCLKGFLDNPAIATCEG